MSCEPEDGTRAVDIADTDGAESPDNVVEPPYEPQITTYFQTSRWETTTPNCKSYYLRFILTDQLCNPTLFSFLWAKKKCWSFLKMYLLLGTKNMHLLKKCPPGSWNIYLPLLLLLPLKPQSLASVVETVKQKAKNIMEEWAALHSWGPHKEREALVGILLLVY